MRLSSCISFSSALRSVLCVCTRVHTQCCVSESQLENDSKQIVWFICLQLHDKNIRDMSHVFKCVLDVFMRACEDIERASCLPWRRGTLLNHSCVVAGGGYVLTFEENWAVPFLQDHSVCLLLYFTCDEGQEDKMHTLQHFRFGSIFKWKFAITLLWYILKKNGAYFDS